LEQEKMSHPHAKTIALVQGLTGVSETDATVALINSNWNAEEAVDRILQKPSCKGDAFIPKKPIVNTGLSDEQQALCDRGRWLQDQVNAVFSVAHSKTRTQPQTDQSALEDVPLPAQSEHSVVPQEQPASMNESAQGSPEKTTPQSPQSDQPQ
jgi:hypothetical protein